MTDPSPLCSQLPQAQGTCRVWRLTSNPSKTGPHISPARACAAAGGGGDSSESAASEFPVLPSILGAKSFRVMSWSLGSGSQLGLCSSRTRTQISLSHVSS